MIYNFEFTFYYLSHLIQVRGKLHLDFISKQQHYTQNYETQELIKHESEWMSYKVVVVSNCISQTKDS